jgi:hypothetical protein
MPIPLTARRPGRLNRHPFVNTPITTPPSIPSTPTHTPPQPLRSCHIALLSSGATSAHTIQYPFIVTLPSYNGYNTSIAVVYRGELDNLVSGYRAQEWIAENASSVVREDVHRDIARSSSHDSSDSFSTPSFTSSFWNESHDNTPAGAFEPSLNHYPPVNSNSSAEARSAFPSAFQMSIIACRFLLDELQASCTRLLKEVRTRRRRRRDIARSSSLDSSPVSITSTDSFYNELHSRRNMVAEANIPSSPRSTDRFLR